MRLLTLLKSKIHRATVTEADVNYIGSITIDRDLIDRVQLVPGELVHVWNVDNGERFETYVLEGEAHSGVIIVNGAAGPSRQSRPSGHHHRLLSVRRAGEGARHSGR